MKKKSLPKKAKNGGSFGAYDSKDTGYYKDGGRAPIKGTKEQYQAYQDSLNFYNKAKEEIGDYGVSSRNTPLYIKTGVNPNIIKDPAYNFINKQPIDLSGRFDGNMNPNNSFPPPKVKQKILPIAGIGINEGNSMGGWYDVYQKPVQPIIYEPEDGYKPNWQPSNIVENGRRRIEDLNGRYDAKWERLKEQLINIQSAKPDLLQGSDINMFNPIPFEKGTYFTRPRQSQELEQGKTDYFDKKTGKLIGTYENGGQVDMAKDGKWIQKAINPEHKGYCTPMTKSTCTPRRKALAKTLKKMAKNRKREDGGVPEEVQEQGMPMNQGTPQEGNQQQMEQIAGMVAQALQQGQSPEQIMQMLVQQGVPQEVAQQVVMQVVQQMQGEQQSMEEVPQGAMGMKIKRADIGTGIGQTKPTLQAIQQREQQRNQQLNLNQNTTIGDTTQQPPLNDSQASTIGGSMLQSGQKRFQSLENRKDLNSQFEQEMPWMVGSQFNLYNSIRSGIDAREDNKLLNSPDASGYSEQELGQLRRHKGASQALAGTYGVAAGIQGLMTGLNAYTTTLQNSRARKEYADNLQLGLRNATENQPYSPGYETKYAVGPMSKWGGRIKPCKECGGKVAYGGKLGFIAKVGTKVSNEAAPYNVITERNEIINNGISVYKDGGVSHNDDRGGNYKYLMPGSVIHSKSRGIYPEDMLEYINYLYPQTKTMAKYGAKIYMYGGAVPQPGNNELPEVPMEEAVGVLKEDLSKMKPGKPVSFAKLLEKYTTDKEDKFIAKADEDIESFNDAHTNPNNTSIAKTTAKLNAFTTQEKKKLALKSKAVKLAITGPESPVFALAEKDREVNGLGDSAKSKNGKKISLVSIPKAGDGWKTEWTQKILAHERKYGQPGGTPDTKGIYDDANWLGANSAKFQKYIDDVKAEIPNFDKLPDQVKVQLVDYKFNTGRNTQELLMRSNDEIPIEDMNKLSHEEIVKKFNEDSKSIGTTWDNTLSEIVDRFINKENPYYNDNYLLKLKHAKEDIYLTTHKDDPNFQGNFDRNWFPRTRMWEDMDQINNPVIKGPAQQAPAVVNPSNPVTLKPDENKYSTEPSEFMQKTFGPYTSGINMYNLEDFYTQFGERGDKDKDFYTNEAAALQKGDKLLNPYMKNASVYNQKYKKEGTYGVVTAQDVKDLQEWYDNLAGGPGKGFMSGIARKYKSNFFDPNNPDMVKDYEVAINEAQKAEGLPEYFTENTTTNTKGNQPFGNTKFGTWHMSYNPIVRKSVGSTNKVSGDANLPVIYQQITDGQSKPKAPSFTPTDTGFKGSVPKAGKKSMYYDPLHPMAVAGPIMNLMTPRDVTPFIEDTGAKDALAASTRKRFTEIQPQLNRLRRATISQRRGVGVDPVSQAQMAQAYSNEYEAANQVYGDKYKRDAAIEQTYIDMQNQLRREAGANRAKALDTLAQREATSRWKKTALDTNAINTIADRILKNRAENRASFLYQDMFPNVAYRGDVSYVVGNGEYPYASGTSGLPLSKEQMDYRKSMIDLQLKEQEAKDKGLSLTTKKYGGKTKLPKKSVKRMK